MDLETLAAYDRGAAAYATDWHEQPAPVDLHELVRAYFRPGPTADVGCGSGRDTAWLTANGFPAIGYDASPGLLAEARRLYPAITFVEAALPELSGVAASSFVNVFCETVIMHMEPATIGAAMRTLVRIAQPGGTIYVSWRVTAGTSRRDDHGRLYAAFDAAIVTDAFAACETLLDEERTSVSSGKTVHRIVVRTPQ